MCPFLTRPQFSRYVRTGMPQYLINLWVLSSVAFRRFFRPKRVYNIVVNKARIYVLPGLPVRPAPLNPVSLSRNPKPAAPHPLRPCFAPQGWTSATHKFIPPHNKTQFVSNHARVLIKFGTDPGLLLKPSLTTNRCQVMRVS